MRNKILIAGIILVFFIAVGIVFVAYCVVSSTQSNIIVNARHNLQLARESVQWYKERTGRYPATLSEIRQYADDTKVDYYCPGISSGSIILFVPGLHKERISNSKGNSTEHDVLDNAGGFYYNNVTGDVRLNLTQPVKEYFAVCLNSYGQEVPSNW